VLQQRPVQAFSNTILRGRIMDGESMFSTGSLQMRLELLAQIFTTTVRSQSPDGHTHLRVTPRLKFSVGGKGFSLPAQEVEVRQLTEIIGERHIVMAMA